MFKKPPYAIFIDYTLIVMGEPHIHSLIQFFYNMKLFTYLSNLNTHSLCLNKLYKFI